VPRSDAPGLRSTEPVELAGRAPLAVLGLVLDRDFGALADVAGRLRGERRIVLVDDATVALRLLRVRSLMPGIALEHLEACCFGFGTRQRQSALSTTLGRDIEANPGQAKALCGVLDRP
jgi:hypothetical protein